MQISARLNNKKATTAFQVVAFDAFLHSNNFLSEFPQISRFDPQHQVQKISIVY